MTLVTIVPGVVFGILGLRRAASCGAGRMRSWLGIGLCLSWAAARERMMAAASEAFRQGVRGAVHEAHICAQPWGFDPAAIKPPVHIWHGDQDTNVPVATARYLAERIPGSSVTIYPARDT